MKKNDLAALILISAFAIVVSYFVANSLIGSPENTPVQVEKVTAIEGTFPQPDPRIFNDKAIDPTVEIKGGSSSSEKPFSN